MRVRPSTPEDAGAWDDYVESHHEATHCHLYGWKEVIENTYKQQGQYLLAEDNGKIKGVLPIFHIKSLLFPAALVSMPYFSYGGTLADSREISLALEEAAITKARGLKIKEIELRYVTRCATTGTSSHDNKSHKVRMLLELPPSPEDLFKSFSSKLRSQIKRPQKEGMTAQIKGIELLDNFYKVFQENMRDLGSPVHSKKLFKNLFIVFKDRAKIAHVLYDEETVAAGIIFRFGNTVEIPWASSNKRYNKFSPNMLLYWALLEYCCKIGVKYFDFGRSTPDEGTYKFKKQWGAIPQQLDWQIFRLDGRNASGPNPDWEMVSANQPSLPMRTATSIWKKFPVWLTALLGPKIRGGISL